MESNPGFPVSDLDRNFFWAHEALVARQLPHGLAEVRRVERSERRDVELMGKAF